MSGKFRRYFLKAKEAKNLLEKSLEKLRTSLEQILKGKVDVEVVETEFAEIFFIDRKPLLAKIGEKVFPTLVFDDFLALASRVVVDMGAVPHVCNGANIMAPGIRRFEGEFRKDDFVLVVDEKYGKSLARCYLISVMQGGLSRALLSRMFILSATRYGIS